MLAVVATRQASLGLRPSNSAFKSFRVSTSLSPDADDEILDDDPDTDIVEEDTRALTCTDEAGNVYENLEKMPSEEPCKLCFCTAGLKICAERQCVPDGYNNCQAAVPIENGKCCAKQYECGKYQGLFGHRIEYNSEKVGQGFDPDLYTVGFASAIRTSCSKSPFLP